MGYYGSNASNTVEGSKVFLTVMPPEGVIVRLGGGVQGLEDYLELGDPKGDQQHSQRGHSDPQAELPHPHVYQGVQQHPLAGQPHHFILV